MDKEKFKSGFVAIIGRPNVGKSTLLNAMLKDKISIVSSIPQTTRHQIKGILNLQGAQIVFLDTPGMHNFSDPLASHLNTIAKRSLEGVDIVLYVVDVDRAPGKEEKRLLNILVKQRVRVVMALNKMDKGGKYINDYISLWNSETAKINENPLLYYLPVSAKNDKNVDELKEILKNNMPGGEPFYDKKTLTDFPQNFRLADIVREKLFMVLTQELPHAIAVEVNNIEKKKKSMYIQVTVYVQRQSQKKIIIGKKGAVLKEAGTAARADIEGIYKRKVFLDISVTILSDWQKKPRILKEIGYWWT
jgi:GTPase